MSAASDDLKDLRDYLDATLTGWLPARVKSRTAAGQESLTLAVAVRGELYRRWAETCVLRGRLARMRVELDGVRAANEILTAELEARRGP
jgi:hypothetical protein